MEIEHIQNPVRYRLYTEDRMCMSALTEDRKMLLEVFRGNLFADMPHVGYTVMDAHGCYKGASEASIVLEVVCGLDDQGAVEARLMEWAAQYGRAAAQECVLLTREAVGAAMLIPPCDPA